MIDWRHFNTLILYHLPILVISLNSSSASAPGGPPEPHPRSSGPRGLPRRPRARRGGPSRTAKCLELAASANYAPHQVGVGAPPVEARLPRAAHSAPRVGVKLEGHLRRRVLLLVRRPLYLYMYWEATLAAQRLLPLFELGSPRHYRDGILWRVCIYERHLGDYGLET